MDTSQIQESETASSSEQKQTGWNVFAKAPTVEEFEPPSRSDSGEVPPRNTADFALFGVPLLNPWE